MGGDGAALAGGGAAGDEDLETVEIRLLLEGIYRHHSYDFREYALGSLRRRLWRRAYAEGLGTISGLQERVLHDPECMQRLLLDLSINVTTMFRDPSFYVAFRQKVLPLLRTYPFIRIWNAGCSTGEEAYSIAILLNEAGLLEKSRIYATDINSGVLERAERGLFPLEKMRAYTENYLRAGGTEEFSRYYVAEGEDARIHPSLAANLVFAQHNLVSDTSFNEFNVIMCRNVMIYFGKALQDRVHGLFYDSLNPLGVLALGHRETIKFSRFEECYEEIDPLERLYRRVM